MQRRQLGSLLGVAIGGCLWPVPCSGANEHSQLFRIARSKNANVVVYRAKLRGVGLDPARPVSAHWLMLAEDGRREELTWAERQLAYGFEVTDVAADRCRVSLLACKDRQLVVERGVEGFRALCRIAGQRAVLQRIFVQTREGGLLPSVQHVDLFGSSLRGAPLTERLAR
jgi:Domain of unknown function (DUF4833)